MKFLQIPDGLKTKALEIADELDGDVVISCESCFGACDLKDAEAKRLGCDKIVHYGHSKMIDSDIEVDYVERREKYDPTNALKKLNIKYNKIGLVSAVQLLDSLTIAKKVLGERGVIGGQILGCDTSNAEKIAKNVDCFLFIGSGKFHAIGVALKTKKPVFVLNIERNIIEEVDVRLFEKQRIAAQVIAQDAKVWGILVSTKPGQMNIKLAKELKKKFKKAYILACDEIRPEKLEGIKVDAYVNTACPRLAIENRTDFGKPILNPDELGF